MVILLAIASTIILMACGAPSFTMSEPVDTTPAEIVGIWSQNIAASTSKAHGANLPDYTLEMTFYDNGTFAQTITSSAPNLSATATGEWEKSGKYIILDGLLMEGGTGNSPWRKISTAWWMTQSGLPGQQLSLYGGIWEDADVWVEFYRVSAICNASEHGNMRRNNHCQNRE